MGEEPNLWREHIDHSDTGTMLDVDEWECVLIILLGSRLEVRVVNDLRKSGELHFWESSFD